MKLRNLQLRVLTKEIKQAVEADKPVPQETLKTVCQAFNEGSAQSSFARGFSNKDEALKEFVDLFATKPAYAADLMTFAQAQVTNRNRKIVLNELFLHYSVFSTPLSDDRKVVRDYQEAQLDAVRPAIIFLSGRVNPKARMYGSYGDTVEEALFRSDLPLPPKTSRFGGADYKTAARHPIRAVRGDYREPVVGRNKA